MEHVSLCLSTLNCSIHWTVPVMAFIGGYHSLEATTHWRHSLEATTLLRQRLALNMSLHHCPATASLDPRFYAHRPLSVEESIVPGWASHTLLEYTTHTLCLSLSLSLYHAIPLSLSLSLALSQTLIFTHTHTLSLSLLLSLSLSLSLPLSLSH